MHSMTVYTRFVLAALLCSVVAIARAQPGVFSVTTASGTGAGSLFSAIQQADAFGNGATINIQSGLGTINVGQLPDITVGMTINGGSGNALSGQNQNRIFFVNAPSQSVQISNLTLANGLAQGGAGGIGGGTGGGGAGLGGAVFINAGAVNFSSVAFANNAVKGGNGGAGGIGGGGGGGGMGFVGGSGGSGGNLLGGGGGGGARSSGGHAGTPTTAGAGGGVNGGAGGPGGPGFGINNGFPGSAPDGGGGGGEIDTSGVVSGVGGTGGNGSDFGGGGGGGSSVNNNANSGGSGGFGAGGGGGADGPGAGNGGNGGFGGGGGGGGGSQFVIENGSSLGGAGGYGGGSGGQGNEGGGGGGAALGAAVFVRGGSVSFTDSSADAGTLTAGSGGVSPLGSFHNGNGGGTAGGALFLMGGNTAVSGFNTQTIAGSIAEYGASSITKSGPGTLVLSAANSYSGGTTISGGELSVASDACLGAASGGLLLNGGLLQVTGTTYSSTTRTITLGSSGGGFDIASPSNTFTVGQALSGNGVLTKEGAGTLALTGANSYSGGTSINSGLLIAAPTAPGATFSGAGTITVNGGAALQLGNVAGQNNVLGSGGTNPPLAINAGGILTTASGTTHNVGVIHFNGGFMIGSATPQAPYADYTLNDTVFADGTGTLATISAAGGVYMRGNISFNVGVANSEMDISAALGDEIGTTGALTKTGSGLLVLSANNTYSGATAVKAGTLRVSQQSLPSSATTVGSNAVLEYVDSGTAFQKATTYTGSGTLRKTGTGTLVFGGQGNVNVNLSAGAVVDVQAGMLVGSSSYQGIWTSNLASLNIAGGATFDTVEGGPTGAMQFDALTGAGSFHGGYFGNAGGLTTVTLGAAGGSGTFSGSLSDDVSAHLAIVKAGSGTQTFSGSNSYMGGTTISGGTLVIAASGSLPAGSAVVNSATFKINAAATAGDISGTGTTSISAGNTLTATSFAQGALAMQLAGAAAAANSKLNVTGALSLAATLTISLGVGFAPAAGNTFDILDWGTLNGTFSSLQLPALAGGLNWNTSQLYVSGALSIGGALGDYNHNGVVDAADYTLWRDTLGSSTSLAADGNGNGSIDAGDYTIWTTNFGNHSGAGASSNSAVPEPTTLSMLLAGILTICCRRRAA
jgi:fibronectin-binding autotransporter adhesin